MVVQKRCDGVRKLRIRRHPPVATSLEDFGTSWVLRGNHGSAARHRLEIWETEAFVRTRRRIHPCAAIEVGEFLITDTGEIRHTRILGSGITNDRESSVRELRSNRCVEPVEEEAASFSAGESTHKQD